MEYMKGIAVTGKNTVTVVEDIPVPELGPYDCLCRVHACGFCSTDFGIIAGKPLRHRDSGGILLFWVMRVRAR